MPTEEVVEKVVTEQSTEALREEAKRKVDEVITEGQQKNDERPVTTLRIRGASRNC
jgi:hypothetical protein